MSFKCRLCPNKEYPFNGGFCVPCIQQRKKDGIHYTILNTPVQESVMPIKRFSLPDSSIHDITPNWWMQGYDIIMKFNAQCLLLGWHYSGWSWYLIRHMVLPDKSSIIKNPYEVIIKRYCHNDNIIKEVSFFANEPVQHHVLQPNTPEQPIKPDVRKPVVLRRKYVLRKTANEFIPSKENKQILGNSSKTPIKNH